MPLLASIRWARLAALGSRRPSSWAIVGLCFEVLEDEDEDAAARLPAFSLSLPLPPSLSLLESEPDDGAGLFELADTADFYASLIFPALLPVAASGDSDSPAPRCLSLPLPLLLSLRP